MTQLSNVTHAPLASVLVRQVAAAQEVETDRAFAYLLNGLVATRLAAPPEPVPEVGGGLALAERPVITSVMVGPHGPTTVGAFTLLDRVAVSVGRP